MTAPVADPDIVPDRGTRTPAATLEALGGGRGSGRGDRTFRLLTLVSGLFVLVILALILVSTTRRAWPVFEEEGLSFVTSDQWVPAENQFGALAFIWGTLLTSVIALLIAVPTSVGIALFTTEAAPRWMQRPIVYVLDLLAAIPSVVYGLWGILVFAPWVQPIYEDVNGAVGDWPLLGVLFGGPNVFGKSFMTAGLILAIMITPIVTSLSREVIATVPSAQREGSYALGATRWETIRGAVLPWAQGGIVGATMLGLGRAMGETIAVALVIGSSAQITLEVFQSGDSMAAVIANQFGEAGDLHRSALIGLGVLLFLVTIVVNMSARAIVGRWQRRIAGE
jgi:phosphate transport system permease protein